MDERMQRLRRARRNSERILSGVREPTITERLATLATEHEPDVYGSGGPVTALEERVAALLGRATLLELLRGLDAERERGVHDAGSTLCHRRGSGKRAGG